MDESKLNGIKAALEAERGALERQLADYGALAGEEGMSVPVDEGFADSAQATAERAEMLSVVEQLQGTHIEVLAALDRIADGSYGRCERCGDPISAERLEALPSARFCVSCQEATSRR